MLSTPCLVLGGVLLIALVVGDLRFSPGYVRRVRVAVAADDAGARTRMYRLTVVLGWLGAALALAVLLAGGLSGAEIGFRLPEGSGDVPYGPFLLGAGAALLVGVAVGVLAGRRGWQPTPVGDIDVLLPRTSNERRWWAAVALTAGTTEEVVYRAFALTVLGSFLPDVAAVVVAGVVFGLAHAYQGRAGVLTTGVLGLLLGSLLVASSSLLPGMALHVLLDLRVLAVRPEPGA